MISKALLIFSLFSVTFATVYVTEPVASTTYSGGKPGAVVSWTGSDKDPTLAVFGPAKISIYVGNAIQQTNLQVLSNSTDVSKTSSITFTPDPTIGPSGSEYFIRIESISGRDSTSTPFESFSAKFTLDSMTGTFPASVQAEISGQSTAPLGGQTTSGTTGPTSTPSLTTSTAATKPTSTSSTTSATAKASSGAMVLNAGWAGIVFGAVVGATMF